MAQIYEQTGGAWALQRDDGRLLVYATEQEANMAAQDTAIDVTADMIAAVTDSARTLVRLVDELYDTLDANPQVLAAAETSAPDAVLSGSRASLYSMQIRTSAALKDRVRLFLSEELDPALLPGVTVRQAINRRA